MWESLGEPGGMGGSGFETWTGALTWEILGGLGVMDDSGCEPSIGASMSESRGGPGVTDESGYGLSIEVVMWPLLEISTTEVWTEALTQV